MANFRLNATRILLLSWGITTIVLCSVYSSLVTTNVIAPKSIVSSWTDYKQLERFTKVFGLNDQQEMSTMNGYSKSKFDFAMGSKVSILWFSEMTTNLFAKYKPSDCSMVHGKSSSCQASRETLFEFLDSYGYVVLSDVQKLKEKLSVCTNTAFFDTET
jgi:hypothetical protein